MKKYIVFIICFIVQFTYAQEVTINLNDFSVLKVYDRISVTLVAAKENKIVIKGTKADDVEVINKGKDLKVRMKFSKLLKGENIEATVYYKNIEGLVASEGSFISSKNTFKATAFSLNAKEGSVIKVTLDVQKLKSKANSGGELEIEGKATNHDATITSGGIIKGKNLITAQTNVSVNAGGEAKVNATDFVEAKTRAGGSIDVYGKPKQVNQKTVAGGSITVMD